MSVRAAATGCIPLHVADANSRHASLTLAFAQPGDTLLYLLLPLHHDVFGVTLAEAGFLLAANRLVRIAGYGWVARFYAERGPRSACLLAAFGSMLSTAGYGLLSGVWPLLIARLAWGLSFAAMNIATQALATAEPTGAARRSGRMRSIVAAGPFLGLLAGAVIDEAAGPRIAFLALAVVAIFAFGFALLLPGEGEGRPERIIRPRFRVPTQLDAWSFIQGVTLDGLFVMGMSVLAGAALPGYAALAAGGALALRYIAEIALGPIGGMLAQKFGPRQVLTALSVTSAAGLAIIGSGALWTGAVVVVCLRGLIQPIPGPLVALENPGRARVPALAALATWRDLGAGTGPIMAGTLIPIVAHSTLYAGAGLLLAMSAIAVGLKTRPGIPSS